MRTIVLEWIASGASPASRSYCGVIGTKTFQVPDDPSLAGANLAMQMLIRLPSSAPFQVSDTLLFQIN